MNRRETLFQIYRCSWKPLAAFELLYKLLAATFFTTLVSLFFDWIVEAAGYSYLTVENIGAFFRNPLTMVLLLFLLLCVAFYSVFDICAILYAVELGRQNQSVGLRGMLSYAAQTSLRIFLPKNWPLALFSLFLLPFLNLGILSGYLGTVALPEVLAEILKDHPVLIPAAAVLGILAVLLLQRWMYVFHYFLLEGDTFSAARKRSAALGKGSRLRDLAEVLVLQASFAVLFLGIAFVVIALLFLVSRVFAAAQALRTVLAAAAWIALCLLFLLFSALSVPLSFCCVSSLYEAHQVRRGEPPRRPAPNPIRQSFSRRTGGAVLVICLICCAAYGWQVAASAANLNIEFLRTTEVTAHRGASGSFPENTMAAFAGAVEEGTDWIELDVQQTRDGEIIVMHDTNLRRTTGLNQNIWDTTYDQIAALDAGSWFSKEFAGEPVPLLSQVLEFAGESGVRLNIELKPTGHETAFEEAVVDLVREADYLEQCVITSQVYAVLERVKEYCPEAKTVYVMQVAYGNLLQLEAADAFSIYAPNITANMVSRVHNAGKEIYAWTVNRQSIMDKLLRLQVDNLITDHIALAKERIYADKTSNIVQEYIAFLLEF